MPSTPPIRLIAAASAKNSNKIFLWEQPIAFKIPISLVRSLTDTNNTFMMPIPPTTNTMAAIAIRSIVNISLDADAASILLPASSKVNSAFG